MSLNKLFTLLSVFSSSLLFAGGMDSGGGGLRGFESNPWFIGSQEVPYCIGIDPEFPMSERTIRSNIHHVLNEWVKFQKSYRLNQRSFNLDFPDGVNRGINISYIEKDHCSDARLKFLIGIHNEHVRKILKSYPPKTLAFAHVIKHDFEQYTHRTSGIIWISRPQDFNGVMFPPYDKRPILTTVPMHEMGHTYGLGHGNKYSFMSSDIFEWMSQAENDESIRDLLKTTVYMDNPTPLISFGRATKWVPLDPHQRSINLLFNLLTGEEPSEDLEFLLMTSPGDDVDSLQQEGLVQFINDGVVHKFEIDFNVAQTNTWPFCKIKLSWRGVAPSTVDSIRSHGCLDNLTSEALGGQIKDKDGNVIPSKVAIGTRQRNLKGFGGVIRKVPFSIKLKMVGSID